MKHYIAQMLAKRSLSTSQKSSPKLAFQLFHSSNRLSKQMGFRLALKDTGSFTPKGEVNYVVL